MIVGADISDEKIHVYLAFCDASIMNTVWVAVHWLFYQFFYHQNVAVAVKILEKVYDFNKRLV